MTTSEATVEGWMTAAWERPLVLGMVPGVQRRLGVSLERQPGRQEVHLRVVRLDTPAPEVVGEDVLDAEALDVLKSLVLRLG